MAQLALFTLISINKKADSGPIYINAGRCNRLVESGSGTAISYLQGNKNYDTLIVEEDYSTVYNSTFQYAKGTSIQIPTLTIDGKEAEETFGIAVDDIQYVYADESNPLNSIIEIYEPNTLNLRRYVASITPAAVAALATAVVPDGEATTGSNLGGGEGVFSAVVGVDMQFKSLVAGTNITLAPSGTEIEISASGGGGDNFANADLNLTGNRVQDLSGYTFTMSGSGSIILGDASTNIVSIGSGATAVLDIGDGVAAALGLRIGNNATCEIKIGDNSNSLIYIGKLSTGGIEIGDGISGDVSIKNSVSGQIIMPSLPTSDPSITGALWNDSGTVKVSL